jgi:hypothetical protein
VGTQPPTRAAILFYFLELGFIVPAYSSSYWSWPRPDICAAPHSGEGQIEVEFDNPQHVQQLVRVFTCVCVRVTVFEKRHGNSRLYQRSNLTGKGLWIAAQRPLCDRPRVSGSSPRVLHWPSLGEEKMHTKRNLSTVAGCERPSSWNAHPRCAETRAWQFV